MSVQQPFRQQSVSVNTAVSTTEEFVYDGEYGTIHVPSGSSLTTLTFHTCHERGGTYVAAYDSAGTPAAITQTVAAGRSYPMPADLKGAQYIKAVGNASGTFNLVTKG